jgi:hypothetical protein
VGSAVSAMSRPTAIQARRLGERTGALWVTGAYGVRAVATAA